MKKLLPILALASLGMSVSACRVNKTQEGKLPNVSVKTSSGQLPAYNVQGPNVEVGSKNETVKVPTVHVTSPNHKN